MMLTHYNSYIKEFSTKEGTAPRLGLLLFMFKSNHQWSADPQWRSGIGDGFQILNPGFNSYSRTSEFVFP